MLPDNNNFVDLTNNVNLSVMDSLRKRDDV